MEIRQFFLLKFNTAIDELYFVISISDMMTYQTRENIIGHRTSLAISQVPN